MIQVANVFGDEPLDGENWDLLSSSTIQLLAFGPIVEPGPRGEIDRLTNVQAGGEACMVGARHREDVFARLLQCLVHLNLLLLQVGW